MAIVSKLKKDGTVDLYDVPDNELEKYTIPQEKLAQMFPKKENPSRETAMAVKEGGSGDGDVQAYNAATCTDYVCEWDAYGNWVCVWVTYPC